MVVSNLLGPLHDAANVQKLYSNPRMLQFFMHVLTVSTKLSPLPPSDSQEPVCNARFDASLYVTRIA